MLRRKQILIWILAVLVILPVALRTAGSALDPYAINVADRYLAPAPGHWFGTDALGRDMLARTLYAAGLSLHVVAASVVVSFVLAMLLGGIAGYLYRKWPDHLISWTISLLYTVPFILIVVAVFAVLEPGIGKAYLVIGLIGWAAPARLVRAEVMRLRSAPHTIAKKAFGFPERHVLFFHILPTTVVPALLSLLYYIPELISIEVGLSFFGLGAQPPTPTLGRLIYEGLREFYTGWWLAVIPATVLLALMTAVYIMARRLSRPYSNRPIYYVSKQKSSPPSTYGRAHLPD